ncbi:PAS domain-containing protein [Actinoplanes sp. NPDC051851]|uniref:PAS domain-containing protein n=1 Tax=Actinoplanes sp. NPDC051851 TaxID=3154753 RepID=UPI0034292602
MRRIAVMNAYRLFDTPPAEELHAVARVAAAVAGVPTAGINLIDRNRLTQLVAVGATPMSCPRADSMCTVRFESGRFTHVPDARLDPAYRTNPWVTGERGNVRFYAAAPLVTPAGYALGTLCVVDDEPRALTGDQIARLTALAGIVIGFFERYRDARIAADLAGTIQLRYQRTEAVLDNVDSAVIAVDPSGEITLFNKAASRLHGENMNGTEYQEAKAKILLYEPDGVTPIPPERMPLIKAIRERVVVSRRELAVGRPAGEPMPARANARPILDKEGLVVGGVLALQDLTAERTRQRLIEQARGRLADANAELRRSNTDLTNFAAAVSHDLVAPLSAVCGYLDLLADEGHERAGAAVAEIARMRGVIDGLLGRARAASGSGS